MSTTELAALVEQQANDSALWLIKPTIAEAYLQQELRKLHEAVETALRALASRQGDWRDIASAPKDGSKILVGAPSRNPEICRWYKYNGAYAWRDMEADIHDATHWQPLPTPPAPEGEGGHVLYETGDADAPDCIKDGNGEVVLGLCRKCRKGEVELEEPCTPAEPPSRHGRSMRGPNEFVGKPSPAGTASGGARFGLLSNDEAAHLPDGYSAPVSMKSTRELIRERVDAKATTRTPKPGGGK